MIWKFSEKLILPVFKNHRKLLTCKSQDIWQDLYGYFNTIGQCFEYPTRKLALRVQTRLIERRGKSFIPDAFRSPGSAFSIGPKRTHGDVICTYKIAHGLLDFQQDAIFAAPTHSGLRRHTFEAHQQWCYTRSSSSLVLEYYRMPVEIVETSSVELPSYPSHRIFLRTCSTLSCRT